jgi:predicted house-cleaning noncanonical NTP pyrophosphatase (MazG superfamily)
MKFIPCRLNEISPVNTEKNISINSEEIKKLLKDAILPELKILQETMIISDIEKFSGEIMKMGKIHQVDGIVEIGSELREYASQFNIEKLSDTMEKLKRIFDSQE